MSGRLRIREARASDEPALRALAAEAMDGPIRIALPQEPDFFAAEALRGEARLGILTDDSDAVLGCGARVVREAWFAGAWRRTGYYCTLRAASGGRNARAVVAAYDWMRAVEKEDPIPVVTSTILSGNARAMRLLTSRRFGLPAYLDAGEITTFTATSAALRRFGRKIPGISGVEVLSGADVGSDSLRAFYETPPHRPLFPRVWRAGGLPQGLTLDDFIVLRRGGEIVAAAALWSQQSFRQVRVAGYSRVLACLRPVINMAAIIRHLPLIPRVNADIKMSYLAFCKISNWGQTPNIEISNWGQAPKYRGTVPSWRGPVPRGGGLSPEGGGLSLRGEGLSPEGRGLSPGEGGQALMAMVLAEAGRRMAAEGCLSFSLHEEDPLLPAMVKLRAIRTLSRLFTISYENEPKPVDFGGAPYIEAAML